MFNKSKLQNAKQKISKLKEKYSNCSNFTNDDDDFDFPTNTFLLKNIKPKNDEDTLNLFKQSIPPVREVKSPKIEITNLFDDAKSNEGEKSERPGSNHSLLDSQRSHLSFNPSPSEHSYCSKLTNKTLKTESIVLSELSNQFEHICFLSSSSDEESTPRLHLAISDIPQTGKDIDNTLVVPQTSIQSVDGNFEIEQNNDWPIDSQEKELSSSKLSEVQSDVYSIVFSGKEDSVKLYSDPVKFETNNSDGNVFTMKDIKINVDSESSQKSLSDKKYTSFSDPDFVLNSSKTQDKNFTESGDKQRNKTKPFQQSKSTQTNKKYINYKTTEQSRIPNWKPDSKLKHCESRNSILKSGDLVATKYSDRSRMSGDKRTDPEEFDLHKKSSHKYSKRRAIVNHSTNFKPSKINRPILKSCLLVNNYEFNEENEGLLTQKMSNANLDGCGYEEEIRQLLWNQVELTRHFIRSHHQMYLTCCMAVKAISDKYNNNCHLA